jgi:hypothetical protein
MRASECIPQRHAALALRTEPAATRADHLAPRDAVLKVERVAGFGDIRPAYAGENDSGTAEAALLDCQRNINLVVVLTN